MGCVLIDFAVQMYAVREARVPIPVNTISPSARDQLELQSVHCGSYVRETVMSLTQSHLVKLEMGATSLTEYSVLPIQSNSVEFNG